MQRAPHVNLRHSAKDQQCQRPALPKISSRACCQTDHKAFMATGRQQTQAESFR